MYRTPSAFPFETSANLLDYSWGVKRATIVRPVGTVGVFVHLPYKVAGHIHNRELLHRALGRNARIASVDSPVSGIWRVGRERLDDVVSLASRLTETRVFVQYSTLQRCTSSCQRARRLWCECSCRGIHHANGGLAANSIQLASRGQYDVLLTPSIAEVTHALRPDDR